MRRCGVSLGGCDVAHARFSLPIAGRDDAGLIDAVYEHLRQWGIVEAEAASHEEAPSP